jgi:hypothetical protein
MKVNYKSVNKYIIIAILILILSAVLYIMLTQKEKYFAPIKFDNENLILNGTKKAYLDTIVYVGVKTLNIKNTTITILPIKNKPKLDLNDDFDVKAYIVYYLGNYYIYVDNMSRYESITVLSHELIHLNQYYKKILVVKGDTAEWNKKTYIISDIPYNDRYWELDAFEKQEDLYNKLIKQLY